MTSLCSLDCIEKAARGVFARHRTTFRTSTFTHTLFNGSAATLARFLGQPVLTAAAGGTRMRARSADARRGKKMFRERAAHSTMHVPHTRKGMRARASLFFLNKDGFGECFGMTEASRRVCWADMNRVGERASRESVQCRQTGARLRPATALSR